MTLLVVLVTTAASLVGHGGCSDAAAAAAAAVRKLSAAAAVASAPVSLTQHLTPEALVPALQAARVAAGGAEPFMCACHVSLGVSPVCVWQLRGQRQPWQV